MGTVRKGVTLSNENLTVSFLPSEGALTIQAMCIQDGEVMVEKLVIEGDEAIFAFMQDMRRIDKQARSYDGIEAVEGTPTLPGLGDNEESAPPETVAGAVAEVKAAGARRAARSTP